MASLKLLGLNIESEIPIAGVPPADGPIEVRIRFGDCPHSLVAPRVSAVRFQAAPGELLLLVDGIGRFHVRHGSEIVVEPHDGVDVARLRPFLFGSAVGALLHQRGVLPLHASVVQTGVGCAVLAGISASGKSTLAWALGQRGLRILTDDVCAVMISGGVSVAQPGPPWLKLWPDMAERFSLPGSVAVSELGKTVVELKPAPGPLVVQKVICLGTSARAQASLSPLAGAQKLEALMARTYRRLFVEGLDVRRTHFEACRQLALQAEVLALLRPDQPQVVEETVDLVHRALTT